MDRSYNKQAASRASVKRACGYRVNRGFFWCTLLHYWSIRGELRLSKIKDKRAIPLHCPEPRYRGALRCVTLTRVEVEIRKEIVEKYLNE